jgi:hypothetical protein
MGKSTNNQGKETKDKESNRPKPTNKKGEGKPYRPYVAIVLSVFCIITGYFAWTNWVQIAPLITYLTEMQGGDPSPETLEMLQSLNMDAMMMVAIYFVICLATFPNFLILAIVGLVRNW